MASCPNSLLRKRALGWNSHSQQRTNILQQQTQKNIPVLTWLEELDKRKKAWTAEEVDQLDIDHDKDLETVYKVVMHPSLLKLAFPSSW